MRWLDWIGGLKLKAIADFLDFGNGSFRSRIQAGTLTADRTLTAPDKTGTIAITADIPTPGATGALSYAAATPLAGRTAIEVQDSTGLISALSLFEGFENHTSRSAFFDRFAGANLLYNVSTTGTAITNPNALWDASEESYAEIDPNSEAVITLDFSPVAYYGFYYSVGSIHFVPYSTDFPASIKFELLVGTTWHTVGTITQFQQKTIRLSSLNLIQVLSARITVVSGPSMCRIAKLRWVPIRPADYDGLFGDTSPVVMAVSSDITPQNCYSPLLFRDKNNSSSLRIAPGNLKFNNGATVSQILTATKTAAGTNPETISVTGAAVGDVAWVSEAVPAKVTDPNTVSFNGAGLSGTIRAVVMRAQ